MRKRIAECVCEFLGTFALVFFGVLSICVASGKIGGKPIEPTAGLLSIALAHGLVLSVSICAGMYISGAQFNPAVSIGLVLARKQPAARALVFVGVQLLASACAAGLVQWLLTPVLANSEATQLGATIGYFTRENMRGAVVVTEAIGTFALMMAVLAGTVDDRAHRLGGFVIGLTVTACIVAFGPLTGASMNPARTFGPAICGHHWDMHWAYWAGPLIGSCSAVLVYGAFWESRPGRRAGAGGGEPRASA